MIIERNYLDVYPYDRWSTKVCIQAILPYYYYARGAMEWEMIDIIVAKKDVKSSKSIYVLRTSNILSEFCEC